MNTGNRASPPDLLDAQAFFLDFLIKNPLDLETRQEALASYTKSQLDGLFHAQKTIGCTEKEFQDLCVVTSCRGNSTKCPSTWRTPGILRSTNSATWFKGV